MLRFSAPVVTRTYDASTFLWEELTVAVLETEDLTKTFHTARRGEVRAVRGVTLDIQRGQTLGLVGESGSGKSTFARMCLGLIRPTSGVVRVVGQDLTSLSGRELRQLRRRAQIVFQEPLESLNPMMSVQSIVAEPLKLHRPDLGRRDRAREAETMLERVGIPPRFADRRPQALSGGQQQRVGIARALVLEPEFVVLDEPTSSLDLSVRAQILELLVSLQAELGHAYLLVSHDLATVKYVSDSIAVMRNGDLVEVGSADDVTGSPREPYTAELFGSTMSTRPKTLPNT